MAELFRYKKLKITHNALVVKGAMGVKPILKEDGSFLKVGEKIYKADEEKRELTTSLVVFNKFDSQGMILDNEDVRDEAIIDFLANGSKTLKVLHSTDESVAESFIEAPLKEAYVVKEDDNYFTAGSFNATYKIRNQEDWDIIKTLELQTSIEGVAELEVVKEEELDKEENAGKMKDFVLKFKSMFYAWFGKDKVDEILEIKKEEEEEMTKEQVEVLLQDITKNEDNAFLLSVIKGVVENVEKEFNSKEEIVALLKSVSANEIEELTNQKKEFETSKLELEAKLADLEKQFKEQQTPSGETQPILNPKTVEII